MLKYSRKKIMLTGVLTIIIIGFLYWYNNQEKTLDELNLNKNINENIIVLNNEWSKYKNQDLRFEINYPNKKYPLGKLRYVDEISPTKNIYNVIISDGGSTQIEINIVNSKYKTIDELMTKIATSEAKNLYIFEKLKISGENAFVYYNKNLNTQSILPSNKNYRDVFIMTAFIIKDNKLYTITTTNIDKIDNIKIWSSFKFLDENYN